MVTGSTKSHYCHVVPNSHFWNNLESLIFTIEHDLEWRATKDEREKRIEESHIPIIDCHEPLTMEYVIIGLKNALGHGYDLKKNKDNKKNKAKMKRKKVYKRIDTERLYQDLMWSPRREANDTPDEEKPPAEWLNYMQQHLNDANKGVYNLDDEEALAQIRKVAALTVRCLEIHGCPKREIPDELLNQE